MGRLVDLDKGEISREIWFNQDIYDQETGANLCQGVAVWVGFAAH